MSKWTSISSGDCQSGVNLLELFYKDPKRWAYTFQTYAFLSRMKSQMNERPGLGSGHGPDWVLFERSVYSDRVCFAANCHAEGIISDMEYAMYCDFHTFLIDSMKELALDGIIYLRSSPETCMARLKQRSRTEEATVSLDYLKSLNQRHEDWLINKSVSCPGLTAKNIPVLVLDADIDFREDSAECVKLLSELERFMGSLGGQDESE